MGGFTQEWVDAHMAKFKPLPACNEIPDEGSEASLMAKCVKYCRDNGYPWWHDRSMRCNQPGFPDLIVYLPGGKMAHVELKAAKGKLRKEQEAFRRQLYFLGHTVHVCRSYAGFVRIMQGEQREAM